MSTHIWLLPALPLSGAAVLLLGGRRTNRWGPVFATTVAASSFAVGLAFFAAMLRSPVDVRAVHENVFTWIPVESLHVDFGLQIDQLSICFVLLITGVGSLIHLYSIGYMHADRDKRRFFAYLQLFLAAMLLIVLADNFVGLYLGWEGVGLASYLLIGFWQFKPSAAAAAKKAFVVNRVGDIGLALALMIMFATFGSVSYADVFAGVDQVSAGVLTALGLLLLLAACAKSAQVPLQSWLGDAMEGPTPVSALIHAATMVTAGVYLITRSHEIFNAAPLARVAVVIVGTVTLLFGAIIGCAKDDIKKVLAASTMSQIGYMVLAAGLGPAGYVFAIMHLLTHGFFKAGLFLGAGSVMHAMDDETDMRRYGGLRTLMPITFVTVGVGYLAIIGIPPFSGFFSKDKIIESAFGAGGAMGVVLGTATLIGAALTAFYMTRMMLLTFFGQRRWTTQSPPVPHESPAVMVWPMILIGIGSVGAGGVLAINGTLENWLAPVVGVKHPHLPVPIWVITVATLVVVLAGVAFAYWLFGRRDIPAHAPEGVSALTLAARDDLYGDAFNEAVLMRPGQQLTRAVAVVDDRGIDAVVRNIGDAAAWMSQRLRRLQTGYVRTYALYILVGTVLVIAAALLGRVW